MPELEDHEIEEDAMQLCIESCVDCQLTCEETIAYSLQMGGQHAQASHIQSLMDCADTCATSAKLMLRESELHPRMCAVCAEACERCAESCDGFADDEDMKGCAEMCRECAQACRQMAGMQDMSM